MHDVPRRIPTGGFDGHRSGGSRFDDSQTNQTTTHPNPLEPTSPPQWQHPSVFTAGATRLSSSTTRIHAGVNEIHEIVLRLSQQTRKRQHTTFNTIIRKYCQQPRNTNKPRLVLVSNCNVWSNSQMITKKCSRNTVHAQIYYKWCL